ncbi:hypothetical protein BGX23_003610 [Mortierella sp. AD031]|nr:hypothetical protein BGX23_003610 [Mortierella sp. AD031]
MSLDPLVAPAHFVPVDHATPNRTLARSRTNDSVFNGRSAGAPAEASQGSRPEASHSSSSSRPDASHVRFGGLFVGLSNPRGGTSISSSLMPIRPDSEDEDEYGDDRTNHITNINTSSNKHSKEQEQDLQQETVDDHVRRDTADTHLQTLLPT